MRKVLLILGLVLALIGCDSQKRCARFVERNPDCFKDTQIVVRDTISVIYDQHDTSFILDLDTVYFKTPCGDVQIVDNGGSINVSQKPIIDRYETKTIKTIHLPCPCNCDSLKAENKRLRKQLRKDKRRTWWNNIKSNIGKPFKMLLGLLIIIALILGWRFILRLLK